MVDKRGATAKTTINEAKTIATKTYYNANFISCFEHEIRILQLLTTINSDSHFPKYIHHSDNDKSIQMSYAGEPINEQTIPDDWDWEQQVFEIIKQLNYLGINHNDIKPEEVLCYHDLLNQRIKLMIVDFGWATDSHRDMIGFPTVLGASFRAPWGFDDRFSLIKSIMCVLNKYVTNQQVIDKMISIFPPNPLSSPIIFACYQTNEIIYTAKDVTAIMNCLINGKRNFIIDGSIMHNETFNKCFGDVKCQTEKKLLVYYKKNPSDSEVFVSVTPEYSRFEINLNI